MHVTVMLTYMAYSCQSCDMNVTCMYHIKSTMKTEVQVNGYLYEVKTLYNRVSW